MKKHLSSIGLNFSLKLVYFGYHFNCEDMMESREKKVGEFEPDMESVDFGTDEANTQNDVDELQIPEDIGKREHIVDFDFDSDVD